MKFKTTRQLLAWNDGSLVNFTKLKDQENVTKCVAYHKESEVWEKKWCSGKCSFVCKRKGRSSLIFMLISSLIIDNSVDILVKLLVGFWRGLGKISRQDVFKISVLMSFPYSTFLFSELSFL